MVSVSCALCPPSSFTEKTHPPASFWRRWRQPGVSTNSATSLSEWTLVMALTSTDTITKMGVSTGDIAMGVRTCTSRTDTGSTTPLPFQANRLGVRRIVEERQEVCHPCIERLVEITPSNQRLSTPPRTGPRRNAIVIASPNRLQTNGPSLPPLPRRSRGQQPTRDRNRTESQRRTDRRRLETRSRPRFVACSSQRRTQSLNNVSLKKSRDGQRT